MICNKCGCILEQKDIIKKLVVYANKTEHLQAWCGQCNSFMTTLPQIGKYKMPFGKHKGLLIKEIQQYYPEYLDWVLNKSDIDIKTKLRIKKELEG